MLTLQRRLLSFLFLVVALLAPAAAHAQFDSATVLGQITDQQGAAVPGATVTLTNLATGIVATTVTEPTGAYQFLNVRVGTYRIEAGLQGFSTAVVPVGRRHRQRTPARRPDAADRRRGRDRAR